MLSVKGQYSRFRIRFITRRIQPRYCHSVRIQLL